MGTITPITPDLETPLLDYARSLGVKMGSKAWGVHIGWTSDAGIAAELARAGARTTAMPSVSSQGIQGWDIAIHPGAGVNE